MNIELTHGDITKQPYLEAVVKAANKRLAPGGGVAGAIHDAAGPKLFRECKDKAPISPSECVITDGYNLPNDYILHCLGPRYGVDTPADALLADCHRTAIQLADKHGILSVGFPAISTGAFGYPTRKAAPVALQSRRDALADAESVERVVFVLFSHDDLSVFTEALSDLSEDQ